ncbi:alpha/beta-hydrolase [Sarocladium strictum]
MSCPECFSGHVNPGTPTGKWETIQSLRTYVAEPAKGKTTAGIIVIVPDAFGVDFINNQILADHYASAMDCLVYLPDLQAGHAAPVRTMINMSYIWDETVSWLYKPYYIVATAIDFIPCLIRNRLGVCWPRVTAFFRALQDQNTQSYAVGVAGFCWGGLHAVKLAHDTPETRTSDGLRPLVNAIFAAHPSNLTVESDIGDIRRNISIAIGDDDAVMNLQQVKQAEAILATKEDVESEVVTRQAEEAEKQAVAWFQREFGKVAQGAK